LGVQIMYRISYKAFKFEAKNALLYRIDPRAKLLISMYSMTISIIIFDITSITLLTIYLIAYIAFLGQILKKILRNLIVLTPLIIIIFLANYLVTFDIIKSLVPAIKLISVVLSMNIFFLTTSPDDFSLTLEKLRIPLAITLAFSLSLRFIIVLSKQLNEIIEAQLSRGYTLDKGGLIQRIKNFIPILVPMIVLSIKRSIDIAETLEVRGFRTDVKHTPYNDLNITSRDVILTIMSILGTTFFYYPLQIFLMAIFL